MPNCPECKQPLENIRVTQTHHYMSDIWATGDVDKIECLECDANITMFIDEKVDGVEYWSELQPYDEEDKE